MTSYATQQRDERRARVANLIATGHSHAEIATRLDCSARTIQRDRIALGIPTRPTPQPLTANELAHAKQLLDDGCSYREVGRTLGRNGYNIARHLPGYTNGAA